MISLLGNTVGCAFIATLTPFPFIIRLFSIRHQLESDEEEKQGEEVDQQDQNEHQVQYEATFVFPTGWPIQEDVGKIQKEHQHFALEKLKAVEERMQQVKNAETKFVEDGV